MEIPLKEIPKKEGVMMQCVSVVVRLESCREAVLEKDPALRGEMGNLSVSLTWGLLLSPLWRGNAG